MHQTRILYTLFLLIIEAALFILAFSAQRTGKDLIGLSKPFLLNFSYAMIGIFFVTLFAIILFPKSDKHKITVDEKDPHEAKLSMDYATESVLEKKSKKQVIKDLEKKGYTKEELGAFLHTWEKDEKDWEKVDEKE